MKPGRRLPAGEQDGYGQGVNIHRFDVRVVCLADCCCPGRPRRWVARV
jgi:hypothetical protein